MRTKSAGRACLFALSLAVLPGVARAEEPPPTEVQVRGTAAPRAPGGAQIGAAEIGQAPIATGSEVVSLAPGFFVDHEDSEGLANDVNVRGFDLEHGGGLEVMVGPIPLNVPAHVHGQGYADMNGVVPESVLAMRTQVGTYDPRQGDFALAGSVRFDLGSARRGALAKGSFGSFGQWRALGLVAPRDAPDETLAAVAVRHTPGFGGAPRASTSASGVGQYAFDLSPRDRLIVTMLGYGVRAERPGVVREDDVDAGRLSLYDAYATPPAFGQGVRSSRFAAGAELVRELPSGARLAASAWAMQTDFDARENFSGAILGATPDAPGPGDLHQTTNRERAFGAAFSYRTARIEPARDVVVRVEPGGSLRFGGTDQAHRLLVPEDLRPWATAQAEALTTRTAGAYLDVDARVARRLHVAGGVRGDAFLYSVRPTAPGGEVPPLDDAASPASPDAATAFGAIASPRVAASYEIAAWLSPMVAYGEGFRSPAVASIVSGAALPIAKTRTIEAGLRSALAGGAIVVDAAVYRSTLSNELVFDAEQGSVEDAGASTRDGAQLSVRVMPRGGVRAAVAATYTRATLDDSGQLVPRVPQLLVHADLGVTRPIGSIDGHPLVGRAGAMGTFLGGRPLETGEMRRDVLLVNATLGVGYRDVEIALDAFDVLGLAYADDAFAIRSDWGIGGARPPSAQPARLLVAGPPRTVLLTTSVWF